MPSARDINHVYPLPQPAYPSGSDNFIRLSNPIVFQMNDLTIAAVNADIIKELCLSTVVQNTKEGKIDLAIRSILE